MELTKKPSVNYVGRHVNGNVDMVFNMASNKIIFKYDDDKKMLDVFIHPKRLEAKILFDQIEVAFQSGHAALGFATEYYEEQFEELKAEFKKYE